MGKSKRGTNKKVTVASARKQSVTHESKVIAKQPAPDLPLGKIACVGGVVPRNWVTRWKVDKDSLNRIVGKEVKEGRNVYLFLSTESLDKETHADLIRRDGDENVPVLVVVACSVPPTQYVANFSLQLQKEQMIPMEEAGFKWEESFLPGLFFMKSTKPGNGEWADAEHLLLPIVRPSQILDAPPEKVVNVHIKFKNSDIVCDSVSIVQDVDDLIEDEELDVSDKDKVIALLKDEKRVQQKNERLKVEAKEKMFRAMVDSMSRNNTDVLAKLEEMKVFKIYPSNTPPPTTNWMGVETGFRKNLKVNRYLGNAEKFY